MSVLPDWAPNIHPLIVHFPIGWWIAAVIVDVVALMLPRAAWANTTASVLYPAGAVSAAVTYLSGRQAAATVLIPGMAHPIVLLHWNWALVTTLGFAVIAMIRLWVWSKRPQPPRWVRAALAAAALAALASLFHTGELGARLVFEHGVGVTSPGAVPPR
ncbi:MAG: DUF2231 domain-containing protein [Vicinamibacterales bacterium]